MRRLAGATIWAVTTLALVSACGGTESANDATDTPTVPVTTSAAPTSPGAPATSPATTGTTPAVDLPDCGSVWVAGTKLPASYRGCLQGGSTIAPKKHPCSFGSPIIEFDNRFYASAGKVINASRDLSKDSAFRGALSACQA